MNPLPRTRYTPVVRTAFGAPADDGAWAAVCAAIQAPVLGTADQGLPDFRADAACVNDPTYAGATAADLRRAAPPPPRPYGCLLVVDRLRLDRPERPVLAVDLEGEPGRTFRVISAEVWGVENNFTIANIDFAEFADAVDPDGVFRGFPPRCPRRSPSHRLVADPHRLLRY